MTQQKERELEQAIAALPRVKLGWTPTPLEPMPRLSEALAGPDLYIKRDDLTGLAFGGNKTRMLEFSLAHALEQGADTVVTGAAVQSNYCRQMAAACAKLGLELHLILRPEREIDRHEVQGNHFIQRLCGAQVTILEDNNRPRQQEIIGAKVEELQRAGRTVFWPRRQDTVDLDAISYAESALEVVRQCRELGIEPGHLYVAAVDTTQVGLVLGFKFLGSPIRVRGLNPFHPQEDPRPYMAQLANQAAERLDLDVDFVPEDFESDDSFVGERYGIPTEAGVEALGLLAQTEGILIDPVYTSKAMSALVAHARQGLLPRETPVIFMHTGGAPALFGYVREILELGQ